MKGEIPIPVAVSASMHAAAGRLLSHYTAEVVVQDVILRFYSAPHRFDPARGPSGGYLLTATRRRALDQVRPEAPRTRREIAAAAGKLAMAPVSVERLVEGREQAEQVVAAMKLLPAAEREAIALAFFGSLTYAAVAKQLGVSEGTVKSRIRTGLARLQRILEALDSDR